MNNRESDEEISRIRARLASLEAERAELEVTLGELERQRASCVCGDDHPVLVADPAGKGSGGFNARGRTG
jgi:hypothetical protein